MYSRTLATASESRVEAEKRTSKARGARDCLIRQHTSAYKARKYAETDKMRNSGTLMIASNSHIQVKVWPDGRVAASIREDTYPGTSQYFLIDGHRFSGDARQWVPISAAGLAALKQDKVIHASWRNWPYRTEINEEDVLQGFATAYADCLKHLRGASNN